MELLRIGADLCAGWCIWSLGHNLGHRWWHDDMLQGKTTFYAHGEREHHRIYDRHGQNQFHVAEDPKELFISFPCGLLQSWHYLLWRCTGGCAAGPMQDHLPRLFISRWCLIISSTFYFTKRCG